jgi:MFS transporter, PPP family, 3-phenylpropionic acid transporter
MRLALLYAAIFVAIGIQLPFFPVWLAAKGLDAPAIGFVLAAPTLVRIFAVPNLTEWADRGDSLVKGIIITTMVAVLSNVVLGFSHGLAAIAAAYVVAATAFTSSIPLADAYALRGLAQHGGRYGPIRLWGSATFIIGSLGAGLLLDMIAAVDLIWLIGMATLLPVCAAWFLAPLPAGSARASGAPGALRVLSSDGGLLAVIAAASLIQGSHAVYYAFSAIQWRAAGLDGTAVATLWALGVSAEIVLFATSARLPEAVGPTALIIIGAVGAFVRWTAMAFDPPAVTLPVLQCLHGLSFGATHLGTIGFLAQRAPPGFGASAQGYLTIALAIVMAAAMGLSGILYQGYGTMAYAAMALAALVGGFCVLAERKLPSA